MAFGQATAATVLQDITGMLKSVGFPTQRYRSFWMSSLLVLSIHPALVPTHQVWQAMPPSLDDFILMKASWALIRNLPEDLSGAPCLLVRRLSGRDPMERWGKPCCFLDFCPFNAQLNMEGRLQQTVETFNIFQYLSRSPTLAKGDACAAQDRGRGSSLCNENAPEGAA